MKRIILIIMTIFSFHALVASDILVTATAAVFGNDGKLLIEIDPAISDIPFALSIVYPSGFNHQAVINTHSYLLTGLAPGQYTVHMNTAGGCTSTVKVVLLKCRKVGGSYICFHPAEPGPKEVAMFLTTDLDGPIVDAPDPTELVYDLYHYFPEEIPSLLALEVHQKGIEMVGEVVEKGSTEFDVPYQDEIATDAMFVMKFDTTGQLIWVYHNYNYTTPTKKGEPGANVREPNSNHYSQKVLGSVFPNPAAHTVDYRFFSETAGTAMLLWTDMLGRELKREMIPVLEGSNTHTIDGLEAMPNGLYYLNLVQDDKIQDSQKVVIQH